MQTIISISELSKTYAGGFAALKQVSLDIRRGEIFALLGPNGAGKTTLISIVCGLVTPSTGRVTVDGHDIIDDYRAARAMIGLVPQELTTDAFESVWNTVSFSRGLFGKPARPGYIEQLLKDLSLWDKKDAKLMMLSGGMKRRVLIAALDARKAAGLSLRAGAPDRQRQLPHPLRPPAAGGLPVGQPQRDVRRALQDAARGAAARRAQRLHAFPAGMTFILRLSSWAAPHNCVFALRRIFFTNSAV